jgi:alkyldihydroxyacetonephosphate synthase
VPESRPPSETGDDGGPTAAAGGDAAGVRAGDVNRSAVAPAPVEGGAENASERLGTGPAAVPESVLDRVRQTGAAVEVGIAERTEAGRDWWPISIGWAAHGMVPARPAAVVRPTTAAQVAAVLRSCADGPVPVTPIAGGSGVCGGAVPIFGGVALDCTGLEGDVVVDERSLVAEVPAGTNGRQLEDRLRATGSGYTLGHWPQSIDLSTVGGWIACRSAGQYSTRYGKIEDMVAGLEVALADGRVVRTGGKAPRAATGPSLTQLFTGSEGVLGVVTKAWLRVHPLPPAEGRRAYGFEAFADALEACRRVLRRGATPAVLRLYDRTESQRSFDLGERCVLVVLDEADAGLLRATLEVVDEECAGAARLDDDLVAHWIATRNDVSLLGPLWRAGIVVDTAEVAGRWSVLEPLADGVLGALLALRGTIAASVHLSHAYPDGACLYFTFAGRSGEGPGSGAPAAQGPQPAAGGVEGGEMGWEERYYRQAWDALMTVVTGHGAAISHHHGIGLNRARFLRASLGEAYEILVALKRALDPAGILNPGKLGLPSPFGEVPWP